MAAILKPKHRSTDGAAPTVGDLADGELAVNTVTKTIFQRIGASVIAVANHFADAPSDGTIYGRKDGAWIAAAASAAGGVPVGALVKHPGPLSDPAYLPMDGRYASLASYPALAALTPPPIGPGANTIAVDATVYAVVWTGSLYVTVGGGATTRTSPDGVTWTTRNNGVSTTLYGIAQSPSLLVAAGYGGAITTSPDGITWTVRSSATTQRLNSITWSSTLGLFVAVGNSGTIVTSPNGISWLTRASGTTQTLNAVRWSSRLGLFIAAGGGGTLLTSPDGITWTARSSGTTQTLACIAESPTTVMVGGNSVACVSSDGAAWTARTNTLGLMSSLMYAAGTWVAFAGTQLRLSQDDGVTWAYPYTVGSTVAYQGLVKDDTLIMPQGTNLLTLPLPKAGYYYLPPISSDLGYLNHYMKVA